MSYNINQIFAEMEQDLIKSYQRSIAKGTEDGDYEKWQARKLRDLQEFRKEARVIVDKHTRVARNAATGEVSSNYTKGSKRAEDILGKMGHKLGEDSFGMINRRKLDALLDAVKNDFNKVSASALRKVDDEYRKTIYKSQVYFNSGSATLEQSIDMATNDFLHKGINSIQYKNGNQVNIASYAEMALRTSNKKAYLTGEGAKMAEWGEFLVRVTSYGGCSDTCLPWQGRIYFDDVFAGGNPKDAEGYPLLSMAMDEGLYHPNCRHTHGPFFEGVSEEIPEKTDEEVEEIRENYRQEQIQRYNERKIREWKRVEEGSLDEDKKAKANEKVKAWQSQQRQHIKDNPNLRRKYAREQI